jgi:hypothetical protein
VSSYFGSKAASGLCQNIIAIMPPHDTYIETHLGGGAIMQGKILPTASALNARLSDGVINIRRYPRRNGSPF